MSSESLVKSHDNNQPASCPWEWLPHEILGEIFIHCLPIRKDRRPSTKSAPCLLTQVCWAWYRLVVDLPPMWSTIVLNCNNENPLSGLELETGTRFLEMSISRSRGATAELYLRVEYLTHPTSLDLVRHIVQQISYLSIIYPSTVAFGHQTYFPRSIPLFFPNLRTLEIHSSNKHHPIPDSDLLHLENIIKSSHHFRCYVFCNRFYPLNGPLIAANMSRLEVVSLREPVSLPFCFFLLQNAPTLRELSFLKLVICPERAPVYRNAVLMTALSGNEIFRVFTHPNLRSLALAHCKGNLSTFFRFITLPKLHQLVIDLRSDDKEIWPHDPFITFLQRSDCRLKALYLIDQPITPSQFLEIVHSPAVRDTLEHLVIQNYRDGERIIDDLVLERLTLPPAATSARSVSASSASTQAKARERTDRLVLCPNVEHISLFVPLESLALSKLARMIRSRLPPARGGSVPAEESTLVSPQPQYRFLKIVDIDFNNAVKQKLGPFRNRGLVLRYYAFNSFTSMSLDKQQLMVLRRHLGNGFQPHNFQHGTGKWDGLMFDD